MQKPNQKKFRTEKVIKTKGNDLYVKWKGYNNSFNGWINKTDTIETSEYFPEQKSSGGKVKVELDLSNYATKLNLKNAIGVDTSNFAKKTDLANLKSDVGNSDIVQLKNVPSYLGNLKSKVDKLDNDKLVPVPVDLN